MFLRIFSLTLEPVNPLQFSLGECRSFFNKELAAYSLSTKNTDSDKLHRYQAVQCKYIKDTLMVIGISQGAGLLHQLAGGRDTILAGANTSLITERDSLIRNEEFGITGSLHSYEFLTPWLALNQQNAKKFYDLSGKTERDAFMQKLLLGHLTSLAKSLDYKLPFPIICEPKVRFRRDRIDNENIMVFLGRFQTNLRIPDFMGIGQSISKGFGTVRHVDQDLQADPRAETPDR
jgi:Cas6b C-terminal domain/Cas6b N-terminal domain